jgi:hypothetical protein
MNSGTVRLCSQSDRFFAYKKTVVDVFAVLQICIRRSTCVIKSQRLNVVTLNICVRFVKPTCLCDCNACKAKCRRSEVGVRIDGAKSNMQDCG